MLELTENCLPASDPFVSYFGGKLELNVCTNNTSHSYPDNTCTDVHAKAFFMTSNYTTQTVPNLLKIPIVHIYHTRFFYYPERLRRCLVGLSSKFGFNVQLYLLKFENCGIKNIKLKSISFVIFFSL